MKQLLLIPLLFYTVISCVRAQENASLVFRNTATNQEFTLRRGDFVKIKMDEANQGMRINGTFRTCENGMIYLKGGRPGIPLDHIQQIRYRPLAVRWLFWVALFLSAILVEIGFLSVFVVAAEWPQIMAGAGLILFCTSLLIGASSLRRIDQVQTNWKMEIRFPPPPLQQMAPIP